MTAERRTEAFESRFGEKCEQSLRAILPIARHALTTPHLCSNRGDLSMNSSMSQIARPRPMLDWDARAAL
jgi:hypothetical protein